MKANLRKFHWMSIDRMKIRNSIIALTLIFSLLSMSVPGYAIMQKENSDVSSSVSGISDAVISAEDVSKRGEFEKHYLLSDGSFVAVSYPEAVHYLTDDGVWEEVDNRLLYDNDVSRIVNGENDFAVSFADSPAENYLAALSCAGRTFSWGLSIAKSENGKTVQLNNVASDKARIVSAEKIIRSGEKVSSEASVLGKKISDAEVFENAKICGKLRYSKLFTDAPEISADYSVYHNKIEEDIFINSPTDVRSFTMNIQSGGLSICLNDDGSVDFLDENGDMQYHIGIPYMEDANGDVLNDIDVSVKQNGNACTVTYTPDESWLTSSDREYPILLDPSVTTKEYNSNIVDTYVYEGNTANHSSEQKLFFGVKSGKIHRVYLKINNLPSIDAGSPILSAKMTLSFWAGTSTGKTAEVYKAAGAWNPSEITYAGQPGYISSSRLISLPFSASNKTMTFDLTDDIAKLYDDYYADENFGYVIKYSDETLNNPDYNTFYATDATLSDKRPVMTVVYGYSLPSQLVEGGIYSLENAGSGSLATVHNGTDANYVNIYQYNTEISARTASQKFKLEKVSATGGYLFRAMCSANGTNRVIDIQRNGDYLYPENGGNAYLYTATASKTQEWLIIGVTNSSFKIVLRNDMTLALTAYPSTANGTSGGKTSSSPGNIFLATYDATNVYQEWRLIDEEDGYVPTDYKENHYDGVYYFNNSEKGKYLHLNGASTSPNAVSGLIDNFGNTIRWKVSHLGNGKYTIQSCSNLNKYLTSDGTSNVKLSAIADSSITDSYLWTISTASSGGVLVKNVATQKYIRQLSDSAVSASTLLGTAGTTTYNCCVWRLADLSLQDRELTSSVIINDILVSIGDAKSPVINKSPSNAIWATSKDFVYTIENTAGYTGSVTINGGNITGSTQGMVRIKSTHKVTGIVKYFDVDVCKKAIVVLPGIMGSAIYSRPFDFQYSSSKTYHFAQDDILWDPEITVLDRNRITASVLSLAIHSNGSILYPVDVGSPIINNNKLSYRKYGAQNVYKNIYLRLCEEFSGSYDVILYEYDWRFDPYDIAVELRKYIQDNHYNDIVFVSHSMGGNVSSYYLALGEETRKRVDKHISVGTPFLGAEKLAYVYDTGDAIDFKIGVDWADLLIGDPVAEIMPNIPAVYSLLPMQTHFAPYLQTKSSTGTVTIKSTYSSTIATLSTHLQNWNDDFYNSAKSHQNLLFVGGKHVTQLVESYYIVGDNSNTPSMLQIALNSSGHKKGNVGISSTSADGDGTVSLHSALINGTITNNILYKYPANNVKAEHVGLIKGEDDQKTFDFICDVINEINVFSYNSTTFYSKYSGYKEQK